MDRVTRKTLAKQVAILNEKNGGLLQNNLELDYAECYGGYCLVDKTYSIHLTPRMSGREMRQYLHGALDWITPAKGRESLQETLARPTRSLSGVYSNREKLGY